MNAVVEPVPDWIPIQAREPVGVDRAEVERRASDAGLPPVRWPDPFPLDSRNATLAATFAKQSGRVVAFSLAAMRQAFAAGRDLSVVDNVLLAAAACELHPRAVLKGIESRSVSDALAAAEERARAAGVAELPALVSAGRVRSGANLLDTQERPPRAGP